MRFCGRYVDLIKANEFPFYNLQNWSVEKLEVIKQLKDDKY